MESYIKRRIRSGSVVGVAAHAAGLLMSWILRILVQMEKSAKEWSYVLSCDQGLC